MKTTIPTQRLILRPYRLSDAPALQIGANSLAVARNLGRMPHPYPEGEAERWIATHDDLRARGVGYPFAIERNGELLGTMSIAQYDTHDCDFEIGYWIAEPFWGQGFATEAARAVLTFAFDTLELPFVRARTIADNKDSARVLGKMGFLATERRRKLHPVRQEDVEMIHLILPHNAFIRDAGPEEKVYKAA